MAASPRARLGGSTDSSADRQPSGNHASDINGQPMNDNLRLSSFNRVVALNLAAVAIVLTPTRLHAQMLVYDPSNYAQNLLTAARSLQQLNTQLAMLANQVKMLENQALHLLKLPYSSL